MKPARTQTRKKPSHSSNRYSARTCRSVKPKNIHSSKLTSFAFAYFQDSTKQNFQEHVTLSSAAGCKLVFCGKLLRSKTTKKATYNLSSARSARCCSALLQNCGFSAALRKAKKLFLAKHQANFPKRYKKNRKYHNG